MGQAVAEERNASQNHVSALCIMKTFCKFDVISILGNWYVQILNQTELRIAVHWSDRKDDSECCQRREAIIPIMRCRMKELMCQWMKRRMTMMRSKPVKLKTRDSASLSDH